MRYKFHLCLFYSYIIIYYIFIRAFKIYISTTIDPSCMSNPSNSDIIYLTKQYIKFRYENNSK